ncbi:MAG: HAD family hydrolase [Nocardioidaceae bacterium]
MAEQPPPRLVATDLDGTLVHSDGRVTPRTREVLAGLDRLGVPVVAVTARPMRWMDDLWPILGRSGFGVVSNGAIVYDVARGAPARVTGIEAPSGLAMAESIRAQVPDVTFALECVSGIKRDPRYVEPHPVPAGSPVAELPELWTEPAVKVMVRCASMEFPELLERVTRAVGDLGTVSWTITGLVEIGPPGVTKASTLALVARDLGVDAAEVVAFGDMPNDIPMLVWAGTAFAMANAHPSVLAVADHVAPGNDEDGVAETLARLFGLRPGCDP